LPSQETHRLIQAGAFQMVWGANSLAAFTQGRSFSLFEQPAAFENTKPPAWFVPYTCVFAYQRSLRCFQGSGGVARHLLLTPFTLLKVVGGPIFNFNFDFFPTLFCALHCEYPASPYLNAYLCGCISQSGDPDRPLATPLAAPFRDPIP